MKEVPDERATIVAAERARVAQAFGKNRAEFASDEETFAMFSTPAYWDALIGTRPCFLVGGRGTGKTTALKGLSFKGQMSFHGREISAWSTVGAYLRMETNVVSAFQGKRRSDEEWTRLFGHYLNLRLCSQIFEFLQWRRITLHHSVRLDRQDVELFAISLGLTTSIDFEEQRLDDVIHEEEEIQILRKQLLRGAAELELGLNNPKRLEAVNISVLGVPLGHLARALRADPELKSRNFLFAIDEFENLRPYQQAAVNTLIKHVGDAAYTIKVGVRDAESWNRDTLAPHQYLTAPADFEIIDIVKSLSNREFSTFATSICNDRLSSIGSETFLPVSDLFQKLHIADEAKMLGVDAFLSKTADSLVRSGVEEADFAYWQSLPRLEQAMVSYWAESKASDTVTVLKEAKANPRRWTIRTGNYSYAMLFTIRRRVRGTRKYYAGWPILLQMSAGNIRYALQLVQEALDLHFRRGGDLRMAVSAEDQTQAASSVGHRVLRELQGASPDGGSLTRLTLGLGRLFGVMAAEPHGHAPEVNQFRVDRRSNVYDELGVDKVLREAVAQGCLIAFAGNKRASISGETSDYDYQLHPIFAAYFVVGHRSKRRMTLRGSDIIALASDRTGSTVKALLAADKPRASAELPSQLALYGEIFDEN